jgi:membrane protein DedA with SNARE-associated domain
MQEALEFVFRHGYVLLLGWVFLEQLGFPIPTTPLLLAVGALSGAQRMSFFEALGMATIGAMSADMIWFQIGRWKGIGVLRFICKISLEPDSCVRRTEGVYSKHGARSLMIAKFLPGLGTVAPPLAGVFHMRLRKFLLFDALGAFVWAGSFLGLGFLFSNEIGVIARYAERFGAGAVLLLAAAFAAYISWKSVGRQRFLAELRIARISPEELKRRMDAGEELAIVDLRHSMDFDADPEAIPGAIRIDAEELQQNSDLLPHDREVILYCT